MWFQSECGRMRGIRSNGNRRSVPVPSLYTVKVMPCSRKAMSARLRRSSNWARRHRRQHLEQLGVMRPRFARGHEHLIEKRTGIVALEEPAMDGLERCTGHGFLNVAGEAHPPLIRTIDRGYQLFRWSDGPCLGILHASVRAICHISFDASIDKSMYPRLSPIC